MSSWRWRTNLPDRYEPPVPHRPTTDRDPTGDDTPPAVSAAAADVARPRNRATRFPEARP